jgi:hypothetical protein
MLRAIVSFVPTAQRNIHDVSIVATAAAITANEEHRALAF